MSAVEPLPCPTAGCVGCRVYPAGSVDLNDRVRAEPTLARDSECPVHGVNSDPGWWRTPNHLRTSHFTDEMPPVPEMTAREAEHDAWVEQGRPYR